MPEGLGRVTQTVLIGEDATTGGSAGSGGGGGGSSVPGGTPSWLKSGLMAITSRILGLERGQRGQGGRIASLEAGRFYDLVPSGTIMLWTRPLAEIPQGWAVCDGTNGTPDLTGLTIIGAALGADPGPV